MKTIPVISDQKSVDDRADKDQEHLALRNLLLAGGNDALGASVNKACFNSLRERIDHERRKLI